MESLLMQLRQFLQWPQPSELHATRFAVLRADAVFRPAQIAGFVERRATVRARPLFSRIEGPTLQTDPHSRRRPELPTGGRTLSRCGGSGSKRRLPTSSFNGIQWDHLAAGQAGYLLYEDNSWTLHALVASGTD